jgi:hypothetical protein
MALLVWTSSYRSTQQIREESAQVRAHTLELRGATSANGGSVRDTEAKEE